MKVNLNNSINLMDLFIKLKVKEGDKVIDATAGNGYDTLKLSKLVGESGKVFSFDIQKDAILNTKKLLKERSPFMNVKLIQDSHGNIKKHVDEEITFSIFNLGYLPKGNKKITTKSSEVIKSINYILDILKPGGIIGIISYIGHAEGKIENKEVKAYLSKLEQKKFNIFESRYINQINNPPKLYIIEKRGNK